MTSDMSDISDMSGISVNSDISNSDLGDTSGMDVIYEFKGTMRSVSDGDFPGPEEIWRSALDKVGLPHVELKYETSLMGWLIWMPLDELEGKHRELEEEVSRSVACRDLRYLIVTYIDNHLIDDDRNAPTVYYEEYWPPTVAVPAEFKD